MVRNTVSVSCVIASLFFSKVSFGISIARVLRLLISLNRSTSCADVCDDGLFKCCMSFWLPCVTFGQNAEIVDGTSCGVAGLLFAALAYVGIPCVYTFGFRSKIRERFGIPGSPAGDFCLHCWCGPCAYLQEARELKVHGMVSRNSLNPVPVTYMAPPVQIMAPSAPPYPQQGYPVTYFQQPLPTPPPQ
eukprot:jgi/Mesvir1/28731/Mv19699-RA.1